jgi:hypothetical protein
MIPQCVCMDREERNNKPIYSLYGINIIILHRRTICNLIRFLTSSNRSLYTKL